MIEVPHTVAAVIEAIFFHSRLFFLSLLLLLYLSLPSLLQLLSVTIPGLSFISHNALWWLRQCKHLTRRSSTTDWDQYRHFIRNIFFSLSLFPSVVSWHFSLFFSSIFFSSFFHLCVISTVTFGNLFLSAPVPSPSILSSGCLWFIHCLLLSTSHSFAATEDASTRALIHTLNILSVSGLQQQQQQQRHCSVCNKHTFYFLSVIIYISNTNICVQSCLKVFSSKKNDDGVMFEKYHWRWWILVCL